MAYSYEALKPDLFSDRGQRTFLAIRDKVGRLIDTSGAFTVGKAIRGITGDSWLMLACIERMVELDEIRAVTDENSTAAQDMVYVR